MGKKQVNIILAVLLFLNVTQLNITRSVGTFNLFSYFVRISIYCYVLYHVFKVSYPKVLRDSFYFKYCVIVSAYLIINMIVTYICTFKSLAIAITFPTIFYLADNILFFYLGFDLANKEKKKETFVFTLWWFAVVSVIAMTIISVNFRMKYGSLIDTWQLLYREEIANLGVMFNAYKNSFPYKFAVLMPFFFIRKSKYNIPLVILCIVNILIVGKRGALLAAIISAIVMFLFSNRQKSRYFIYGGYAILLFLFYYIFIDDTIFATLEYRMNPVLHYNAEENASFYLSGRDNIWKTTFDGFLNSSFLELLFGHGTTGVLRWLVTKGMPGNAHNAWLEILYNYGVLSVFVYVSYYIYMLKMYYNMRRDKYEYADFVFFYLLFILACTMVSVTIYGGFQSMAYSGILIAFFLGRYLKLYQQSNFH